MLRTAVFSSLIVALIFVIFNAASPSPFHTRRLSPMATSLAGWHSRATPYTNSFTPERSALRLAILRNAPADPEGFTLALFDSPAKIAVDAGGSTLVLQDADFDGLVALAEETKKLPQTGRFRNTWVVAQPITSRPIERILVPVQPGEGSGNQQDFKETSVQGYDGVTTHLKQPVGDIQDLPPVLQNLVGLVLEAREGGQVNKGEALISQTKSILGDDF